MTRPAALPERDLAHLHDLLALCPPLAKHAFTALLTSQRSGGSGGLDSLCRGQRPARAARIRPQPAPRPRHRRRWPEHALQQRPDRERQHQDQAVDAADARTRRLRPAPQADSAQLTVATTSSVPEPRSDSLRGRLRWSGCGAEAKSSCDVREQLAVLVGARTQGHDADRARRRRGWWSGRAASCASVQGLIAASTVSGSRLCKDAADDSNRADPEQIEQDPAGVVGIPGDRGERRWPGPVAGGAVVGAGAPSRARCVVRRDQPWPSRRRRGCGILLLRNGYRERRTGGSGWRWMCRRGCGQTPTPARGGRSVTPTAVARTST